MSGERIDYNNLKNNPEFRDFDHQHTAGFNEMVINVYRLHELTENHPVSKVPLSEFLDQLDHECWDTESGARVTPREVADMIIAHGYDVVKEKFPDFAKHIKKIKDADYSYPIHVHRGIVIDGSHRLSHLYVKQKLSQNPQDFITVKNIKAIPKEAIISK